MTFNIVFKVAELVRHAPLCFLDDFKNLTLDDLEKIFKVAEKKFFGFFGFLEIFENLTLG
mgnify:FL=1